MELIREIERWWPLLLEDSRAWLSADPDRPLTADVLTDLVRVRGYGPASGYWVGDESPDGRYFLSEAERSWISERKVP